MSEMTEHRFQIPIGITKRDDERRLVFGFAKFSEDPENRGNLLIDRQGDIITPDELENSAYEYVLTSRDAGEMHVTKGAASLVESVMITPEKLEAWGLPGDSVPIGWWTGYKVHEPEQGQPDPWDKVKKGEYTAFSVEGIAYREAVTSLSSAGSDDIAKSADELEEEEKHLEELVEKANGLMFDEDHELSKDSILLAARMGRITPQEAEFMLEGLVESQADAEPAEEESGDDDVVRFFRRVFGIAKHKTDRPHPESAHGNRLYSPEADPTGDMLKQLKTRFKRVENSTLTRLQQRFGSSAGERDALTHDQIVAELARRNLIKPTDMKFKTQRFQNLKDEIIHAITAELGI